MNEHEHCVRWEPVQGIAFPCSNITFSFEISGLVVVRMYFSQMRDVPNRDLVLKFKDAIAFKWDQEAVGWIHPLPQPIPAIDESPWAKWGVPLLQVINSSWLAEYADGYPQMAEGRAHFVLLSLSDEVQILASPDVEAEWVDGPADRDETDTQANAKKLWRDDGSGILWYKGDS
jgi:hypothetical protein